jgi:DNA helicase-2/ATP-dependent DNA helicase PcrA
VGLGGLLLEPEVVDVVSMLRVLADPLAGAALLRLLAGPRWRIGPRDLDVLGRRARELSRPPADPAAGPAEVPTESDVVDDRSLLDALEDPGPPGRYSAEGHRRLLEFRDEVRRLRRWATGSLPDVVTAVIAGLGLDVELAARPGIRPGDAMLSLDRLIEVAEDFAAAGEDAGILAFLSYLDTAEDRERGLELEVAALDVDRVQLMTVHAAKGLEWDAVFVVGLTATVFPVEGQAVADWTRQPQALPFPLRGDRSELPELDLRAVTSPSEAKAAVVAFSDRCKARSLVEERRLAYVALTRARSYLSCSAAWWDDAQKPRGPSALHDEVAEVCRTGAGSLPVWSERPADDAENPITAEERRFLWPYDPLGTRRDALEQAAKLVRAAMASDQPAPEPAAQGALPLPGLPAGAAGGPALRERWARDVDLLLAELSRAGDADAPEVPLPAHLSVSQLVTLRRDPNELARQIRRPLPRPPAPQARRGTRFHLWLEQHWGQPGLLDVDELPGSADESAEPDENLRALQEAFQASEWWVRVPAEVEFPFDMVVEGVLLRGRCDAVFTDAPDGLVDVVDWKTGKPPTGAEKDVVAIQLAVYRLAWHYLSGTPLEQIRAAFHYVGVNRTVRPVDLLDEEQIRDLLRSVPGADVRP